MAGYNPTLDPCSPFFDPHSWDCPPCVPCRDVREANRVAVATRNGVPMCAACVTEVDEAAEAAKAEPTALISARLEPEEPARLLVGRRGSVPAMRRGDFGPARRTPKLRGL